MLAMMEPGQSNEGTSAVKFQKLQLYPRRVFYAAEFPPGGYAVVDSSYERLCFRFQIGDAPPAQSKAGGESTGSMQALQVEGKTVRYEPSSTAPNQAIFNFVSDGYRNTYALDCERRQFRWIENVRVSTGRVTGNSQGSDWRPMSPRSTISNAVYDAVCPGLIGDGPRQEKTKDAEVTGGLVTVSANPSFDCTKASTWSENAVCHDQAIALLDTEVAALYKAARQRLTAARRDDIKKEQLAWLRKREACSREAQPTQCLRRVYELRISQLRALP
jgi:uncharacterized protein YecT (DUF1311 family)